MITKILHEFTLFALIISLLLAFSGLADAQNTQEKNLLPGVKNVFFVGDSFTDGAAWPYWLVETLKAHGSPDLLAHNAAVCNSGSDKVRGRYAKDVLTLKPDMVVISISGNDIEAYRQDITYLITSAREAGAKMVLLLDRSPLLVGANDVVIADNQVLHELGKQYNCPVGEVFASFTEAMKAQKTVLCPDGVHPTVDGWRLMGRCALDALGCSAPMVESIPLYPNALVDWWIGPGVTWNPNDPVPADILAPAFSPKLAGWNQYDLAAATKQSSPTELYDYQLGGINSMLTSILKGASGAFALTTIKSKKAKDTVLHTSDFPTFYIWLNGKPIWTNAENIHGLHPDAARIPIHLQKGVNRLLVFSNNIFNISLGDL